MHNHGGIAIYLGDVRDVLATLPDESVHCVVTSPPYYGLRDYGCAGQIGSEETPAEYLGIMVAVFEQARRVLSADGTLWLNMGDSYANDSKWGGSTGGKHVTALHGSPIGRGKRNTGLKAKDLIGMPWELAFALRSAGWYLRADIIWNKPNPMPESVLDRPTKAHEYLFLLSKSERYHYDADAIKEPGSWEPDASKMPDGWDTGAGGHGSFHREGREKGGRADKQRGHGRRHDGFNECWDAMEKSEQCSGMRNKRDVWTVSPQPFPEAHFATFPEELIKPCILAGCPAGGTVLDPFFGSGTTGLVARANGCKCIGIELNPDYIEIAKKRLAQDVLQFSEAL